MKSILLVSAMLFGSLSFAGEPFNDYNFTCKDQSSGLQIQGGVDPSGGFFTHISAPNMPSLNNLDYEATRKPVGDGLSTFTSARYVRPKIVLSIHWDTEVSKDVYQGELVRQ